MHGWDIGSGANITVDNPCHNYFGLGMNVIYPEGVKQSSDGMLFRQAFSPNSSIAALLYALAASSIVTKVPKSIVLPLVQMRAVNLPCFPGRTPR